MPSPLSPSLRRPEARSRSPDGAMKLSPGVGEPEADGSGRVPDDDRFVEAVDAVAEALFRPDPALEEPGDIGIG